MPTLSARAQFTPRNALGQFVDVVIRPGVVQSVQAAADLIRDGAKERAPVDTGALRDSIETRIDDGGKTVLGYVTVGVPYASYVEFGTGKLGDPAVAHNENWPGMRPQPYLRPSYDEARGAVLDLFRSNISLSI